MARISRAKGVRNLASWDFAFVRRISDKNKRQQQGQPDEAPPMMFTVFATLFVAFVLDFAGWGRSALACLTASLGICIYLFMWEIYSPEYGFRMPWLEVELKQFFGLVRGV
jgi:hypothetical protein